MWVGKGRLVLVANQSVTSRPRFKVDGLAPNTIFTMDVYALNAKGRLKPLRLKTRTRKVHVDVKYSFSAGKKAFKKLVCWCGLVSQQNSNLGEVGRTGKV